jgi:sulfite dehydrogenase (cytochrome) subunit B
MTEIRSLATLAMLLAVLCVAAVAVSAAPIIYNLPEETAKFQPGPGVESAQINCSACHSADYISTQPPKQGNAFWQAEVTKMIKIYGAPIAEQDVNKIAEYLATTY